MSIKLTDTVKLPGTRKFYDFSGQPDKKKPRDDQNVSDEDSKKLAAFISRNVIGSDMEFLSPYGLKPVTYCDYIASGKSLQFIEDFILRHVLPSYANTHTTTSVTSLQTTLYRHEARDIFRNAVHASEHDAVIFTGNGCTGAVHKLINGLSLPENKENLVIFASAYEHHSNLLPWRELGAEIIMVPETQDGLDLEFLEAQLVKNQHRRAIGCFCAASNITGIMNDDILITALLHKYGALSFWDYATAAPYTKIDMNPKIPDDTEGLCHKDAVFFSVHKFVGGVQTPGVLIAKKFLFSNPVPNGGGGGSVFFVTNDDHRYLKDTEVREEGGTPAIVESIRAGMVMQLKEAVGTEFIMKKEHEISTKVRERLGSVENLIILGAGKSASHLPIFSFLIREPSGLHLHHNFVSAILNDVFGIQSRGGCLCAGPYAQSLLGISPELAKTYERALMEDDRLDRAHLRRGQREYSQHEILRPGFTRINVPWFVSDEEVDFIIRALEIVAEHGWKLLPQYRFNNETGEWKHHTNMIFKERKWLGNVSYVNGEFSFGDDKNMNGVTAAKGKSEVLSDAAKIFEEARKTSNKLIVPDQTLIFEAEYESLRWFLLPCEAKNRLKDSASDVALRQPPFSPQRNPHHTTYNGATLEQVLVLKDNVTSTWSNSIEEPIKLPVIPKEKNYKNVKESEKNVICNDGECFLPRDQSIAPKNPIPQKSCKWRSPTKDIFRPFLEAMDEFEMVKNGDRVLVCLSGGKDSLTLLHAMHQYQFYAKKQDIQFELGAITVDPGSSAYDPRPLIPYLKSLGVKDYFYEEQPIMAQAMETDASSICAFCSRMKRGRIYHAARREGYNVLAMGQHLDDMAESFLMSVFHNGRLRTMKANYTVAEGDLRVIRPFAYVREKSLRSFAEKNFLPIIPENCPACFESPKERHRTKQLLAQQELLFPRLYHSLKTAMNPVMKIRQTGMENVLFGKTLPEANETPEEDDDV